MYHPFRITFAAIALCASAALAQEAARGAQNLVTKDLTNWKLKNEKANLWKVAADVKVSQAKPKEFEVSGDVADAPILVNDLKEKQHGSDIYTAQEFGDCEVHVELMVPKGSNSGVYLMGRYEVQILDSFGKKRPGTGDLGGIYNTKAPEAEGYAPKPPGQWQTLDIIFQAPRFDESGKKTANAKFVSIKLNGKEIQKDVEAPKPTGGELSSKEAPKGPLMFQGDHGPVAIRTVRVKETGR
jgi:hypothetical protein